MIRGGEHAGQEEPAAGGAGQFHWLPELEAFFFGNKWLPKALLEDIEISQFSVGK